MLLAAILVLGGHMMRSVRSSKMRLAKSGLSARSGLRLETMMKSLSLAKLAEMGIGTFETDPRGLRGSPVLNILARYGPKIVMIAHWDPKGSPASNIWAKWRGAPRVELLPKEIAQM